MGGALALDAAWLFAAFLVVLVLIAAGIAARRFLLERNATFIINVVDAALLSRSLELTLEILELGIPMLVCLNMADEAETKGMAIDEAALAEALGAPVVKAIASPRGDHTGVE